MWNKIILLYFFEFKVTLGKKYVDKEEFTLLPAVIYAMKKLEILQIKIALNTGSHWSKRWNVQAEINSH